MVFNNSVNMLTREGLIKIFIDEFNTSKERELMMEGERYYKAENNILKRKMLRYEDGRWVNDETKVNNRLAHGFMRNLVDDKINYLLLKPLSMDCKDEAYLEAVKKTLGKRFQKRLAQLGYEASNKGIAWLHPYINSEGEFKTMRIPSEQCIPIWTDNDQEELEAFIRYYSLEVYEGKDRRIVTKIEYHTADGVEYYEMTGDGEVILDAEKYLEVEGEGTLLPHFTVNGEPGAWGKVPFIPFKNNDYELPDLQFVKTLVDDYDRTRSDISNLLEEVKSVIYALRGYGGENLGEFMRDLAHYRAIKLDADEHAGIDLLQADINIEAAEKHWEALKKDIFDFGQGVDENKDKIGNSPSGIALRFLYAGLDLKCNTLEEWFKWGFKQLLYFVNKYHEIVKLPVSDKEIRIVFNRDIAVNESQAITDCQNSKGVISNRTIVANHPWVEDVKEELKQIERESKADEPPMFEGDG
jgi:SPP1 family phage portal protein